MSIVVSPMSGHFLRWSPLHSCLTLFPAFIAAKVPCPVKYLALPISWELNHIKQSGFMFMSVLKDQRCS